MFIRNVLFTAVSAATLGLTGCLDSGGQTNKNANPQYQINGSLTVKGTHPLFDPLATEFVIPSDALFGLSDVKDGTMLNGTDPANPVTQGIGFLDGASVLAPIDVKISASLDSQQILDARGFVEVDGEVVPNPDQNVFLIPVEYAGGDAVYPTDAEAAGLTPAAKYREALKLREQGNDAAADAIFSDLLTEKVRVELLDIDGGQNNLIRVLPLTPLESKTQYVLALTNDIVDANGEPLVGSPTYQSVADPERVLSNAAFQPFRKAMLPARKLAADYFDFKRDYDASAGFSATFADVPYATAITTTAVEDVLLANAAPITYFRSSLQVAQRQEELGKLVDGFYNLSDQPLGEGASGEESAVNSAIYTKLTDPAFRLYDESLATILTDANGSGTVVTYDDVVADKDADRRIAHAIQVATAEASDENIDIETQAQAMATAADPLLDSPKPRTVSIFSEKEGGDVNPALRQSAGLGGLAVDIDIRVYEGEITLPYFQSLPEEGSGDILKTSSWQPADFSGDDTLNAAPSDRVSYRFPFAEKQADTTVPIVVAAPSTNSVEPANGYPVIIYQHAATTDRSAILPMATAAGLTCIADNADDCFVTIGIDQPLHGIFDTGIVGLTPISSQSGASAEATERHFGYAADANLNAVAAAELEEPESGTLFLNFANYANTRDNMRQGALDLLNVNASLEAIDAAIDACSSCTNDLDIDSSRVYFLTHSLSGMGGAAVPYVTNVAAADNANLNPISASNFFNTGGGFTRLVENSQSVAPRVLPGLDDASDGILTQGRTELNIYFNVFQGLLDSADPAAFAPLYEGEPLLLTEIVGVPNDADRPTDNTVPNAADAVDYLLGPLSTTIPETGFVIEGENMPLAGTDPMAAAMDAESTPLGADLPYITRYLEGSHGNPISAGQKGADAFSSSAVFTEMTAQMLELFTLGSVSVSNPCVVKNADTSGTDCSAEGNSDAGDGSDGGSGGGDGGGDTGGGDGGIIGDIFGA
ncbi:hypothetical protein [Marinobacter qingdaonensis]|uniref:Bacterial virulence factor lipase N-terminal domain-containing protein n=1 Tax=Marinobacter qingdaonensis TaxID=3108486 RepID=A0ABU5NW80_9GAMM|nr:hypothetical protein [Marinobacter sp. ASW11-75]MEA1079982.1 hypothetical protein [Marinobacter sp. ASW11-75]